MLGVRGPLAWHAGTQCPESHNLAPSSLHLLFHWSCTRETSGTREDTLRPSYKIEPRPDPRTAALPADNGGRAGYHSGWRGLCCPSFHPKPWAAATCTPVHTRPGGLG